MKLTKIMAGTLVLLAAGCNHDTKKDHQDDFFPDWRGSSVKKLNQTQTAAGARSDGMLYARHFDGEHLNSLGKQKLSLMLGDDTAAKPMTVYLVNAGTGDLLEKRKGSITAYLKDGLRPDEKVEFVNGTNPNAVHPAAESMARLGKTESGKAEDGGSMTDQPTTPAANVNLGIGK